MHLTNITALTDTGVMVSALASSVVNREFKLWSGQTKDYKIGICCFSSKYEERHVYTQTVMSLR